MENFLHVSVIEGGLTRTIGYRNPSRSGRVLRHLVDQIRKWAAPVAEEILRSVAYSGRPGLRMMPVDVILLGPGCIVPGLAEILTQEVNIHTTMWSMRDTCGRFVSGESAIPFAMSALEVMA